MINRTLQNGKYRIVRVLGQGGFGITYEGVQTGLNRRVAIKEFFMSDYCERDGGTPRVTVVGTYGNRQMVERFKQKFIKEAQMIAGLDGVKHIIRIYDIFEENNTAYYVMEYIGGGSLADIVRQRGRLDESTARRYISQLADALSVLHSRRIMHLDIKPDNILLKDGEVVLIDFGISKHYDQWGNATTTTPVGRSKGYAPIEQYQQGGVQSFSPETDIYSMGATLFFLLTGQVPPEATLLVASPISFPPYVSSNMRTTISKAMKPSKNDRPHTVGDFFVEMGSMQPKTNRSTESTIYDDISIVERSSVNVISHRCSPVIERLIKNMVKVDGGSIRLPAEEKDKSMLGSLFEPFTELAYMFYQDKEDVELNDFYIGKYVVTQIEWEEVMGANPSIFKGESLPVGNISWDDCQSFINKLNSITNKRFRLPKVAEWQYAARGGRKGKEYKYAGSNIINDVAWYKENSHNTMQPVGLKCPNELGLYDMLGNIYEWCYDNPWRNEKPGVLFSSYKNYAVLEGGSYNVSSNDIFRLTFDDKDTSKKDYGLRLFHDSYL